MGEFIDFFLQTDEYLLELAQNHRNWTYFFIFLIVFCESGILVCAFLPGDGFLLAVGIIAATGALNIHFLIILILIAAIAGYFLNYYFGHYFGKRFIEDWIKKEHLEKTQLFYDEHGSKAVIIGRFFPYIRTFVPFLAGVAKMDKRDFIKNTVLGAFIWIGSFTLTGYLFGEVSFVRDNFFLLYLGLVVLTLIPLVWKGISFKRA